MSATDQPQQKEFSPKPGPQDETTKRFIEELGNRNLESGILKTAAADQPKPKESCYKPAPQDEVRSKFVVDLGNWALANFNVLDPNKDGYISPMELSDASRYAAPGDKDKLARILGKEQDIADLSNDEWGAETTGITMNDLKALVKLAQDMPPSIATAEAVKQTGLDTWDMFRPTPKNQDPVTASELGNRIDDLPTNMPECTKQTLKFTYNNIADIGESYGKSHRFTIDELKKYPSKVRANYKLIDALSAEIDQKAQ